MNANTSADGEVTFGTDHFSKYVIVNHGDNNVTVTIEHYDNSKYQAQDEQSAKFTAMMSARWHREQKSATTIRR